MLSLPNLTAIRLSNLKRTGLSTFSLNRNREYLNLFRMLSFQPDDFCLDVGCGDGFWTSRIAKYCNFVIGMDPDAQMLEYARTCRRKSNILYMKSMAECLPFPSETFDKIVSISCLEHFNDPFQGLIEMVRVLKSGGQLALSVDSLLPENSPHSFREWHKKRHYVTRYFSEEELISIMQRAGLRCEPQRTIHLFRSRITGQLRQVFIRHPRTWLPLFPFFYAAVRLADLVFGEMHGQIIVLSARK